MLTHKELKARAVLFSLFREFFTQNGFLEVDTPIRQPHPIPEANIVPIGSQGWFLQSSPEIYMKRLLAAGSEKIFQISRCFRAGEKGRLHLEEFVLVEWYRLGDDYWKLMEDCEHLLRFIARSFKALRTEFSEEFEIPLFSGRDFTLMKPYDTLLVEDAFAQYCPISIEQALAEGCFDEMLVEFIEPNLGLKKPLFLYDYPVQAGSLAKVNDQNSRVVERFELYIQGIELANGFSELTDGSEQRKRFEKEFIELKKGGLSWDMPETFLKELDTIDTAAGIALGFDRLLMLVMGKETVSEVIPFPAEELS